MKGEVEPQRKNREGGGPMQQIAGGRSGIAPSPPSPPGRPECSGLFRHRASDFALSFIPPPRSLARFGLGGPQPKIFHGRKMRGCSGGSSWMGDAVRLKLRWTSSFAVKSNMDIHICFRVPTVGFLRKMKTNMNIHFSGPRNSTAEVDLHNRFSYEGRPSQSFLDSCEIEYEYPHLLRGAYCWIPS